MSYFLPSFFHKRLLRYALSRVEIVDTDALDLDSLGITWGQRSTFELRDIGLRLEKLASTLQLPPEFTITKACVSLARVTIPADIYASGIIVESEGIQLDLKYVPNKPESRAKEKRVREGRARGHHDKIPLSTTDLAQSFLESEPVEETAELEAALTSQSSQYIQHPEVFSDDGYEESEGGLHAGVTLPGFVAGFIKGVIDRLQLKVKDVSIRVVMEVQQDVFPGSSSSVPMKPVSALLTLGEVSIDGVAPPESTEPTLKAGKRLIALSQLRAMLVSDETSFSNYSRSSSPYLASPISRGSLMKQDSTRSQSSQSSSFRLANNPLAQSTILEEPLAAVRHFESAPLQVSQDLQKSVSSSNDGRYDDADSDEERAPEFPDKQRNQALESSDIRLNRDELGDSLNEALESSIPIDLLSSTSNNMVPVMHLLEPDTVPNVIPDVEPSEEYIQTLNHGFQDSSRRFQDVTRSSEDILRESQHLSMSVSVQSFHSVQEGGEENGGEELQEEEPSTPLASENRDHGASLGLEDNGVQQGLYPHSPVHSSPALSSSLSESFHPDELSESTIFSPEQARSIYMSVMSDESTGSGVIGHMPGAWSHRDMESIVGGPANNAIEDSLTSNPEDDSKILGQSATPRGSAIVDPISALENGSSVLPASSTNKQTTPLSISPTSEIAKNIVDIDKILLWLPPLGKSNAEELSPEARIDPIQRMRETAAIPGQASASSNPSRIHFADKVRRDSLSSTSTSHPQASNTLDEDTSILEAIKNEKAIEINISSIGISLDIACGWLLVRVGQNIAQSFKTSTTTKEEEPSPAAEDHQSVSLPVILTLSSCSFSFMDSLPGHISVPRMKNLSKPIGIDPDGAMLHVTFNDIGFQLLTKEETTRARLTLQNLRVNHLSDKIISFDGDLKMRDSTRDIFSNLNESVSLSFVKAPEGSRLNIQTLPIRVLLNTRRLDETLNWLGGLSTIIELGNSIASATTARGDSPDLSRRPKTVHFTKASGVSTEPYNLSSKPWKVNSRIGGVVVQILGEHCSVNVETSAVKFVSRAGVLAVQVDRARVTGPHLNHMVSCSRPTPLVALDNLRLEYLLEPKESDLDRLLTLLTPSKNKYDEEDDIMIDTLLRQRRQGPVLRLTIGGLTVNIESTSVLQPLSHLGGEVSKLSRVATYLPQDDRPGLLVLTLVREFEVNVSVGGKAGDLRLQAKSIEVGYVTFPSLLASRISSFAILRNGSEELLGQAVPYKHGEKEAESAMSMVMVRYIADELEPAVKLKLFNIRVEYRVETMMAFMDLKDGEITAEDVAANMAQSVVNFAELPAHDMTNYGFSNFGPGIAEPSQDTGSPRRIRATLKDCLVGLTPRNSPAKSYAVLTHVEFNGITQNELRSEATLKVAKASMMIVDRTESEEPAKTRSRPKRSTSTSAQIQRLEDLGYVSVCDTSSAHVSVKIVQLKDETQKTLDVELRDDLLILETCADSTQTLIAILNGLSPPTPPSTTAKYRTEIMPITDLLESFAGDAFEAKSPNKTGLANIQEDSEGDGDISAAELDYISDFFPFHASVKAEDVDTGGEFEHLENPSHSDVHVSPGQGALDFEENHFSKQSAVGGTAHRWDASKNTYSLANEEKLESSPLRVRVRDVHVIWNLYDGYDWWRTREAISKSVKDLQARATERRAKASSRRLSRDLEEDTEPVIDDFLFNSVYIEIPSNKDPRDLPHDINRNIDGLSETGSYATTSTLTGITTHDGNGRREKLRLARSQHHKMTFELQGVSADVVIFPSNSGETQSSIDVRIHDLEIFDHMPTSTWRKFATYMHDIGEREIGTNMVHIEILNVKPIAELAASEIILKATVLPLRLHVDHDALDFLTRFFEFKDETSGKAESAPGDVPFLQRVEINPIPLRLDFKPKRLDYAALRSGRTTELMNIFVLDEADMVLRHAIIYGVSGFEKLGKTLNDIWTPDVRDNQLGGVLSGLAPVKSLVTLGSGVRDLIVIPIREYKKDGRIVRGLQKGAFAFAKTTTSELIRIGAKLAIGTQNVLQGAEGYLNGPGSGPSGSSTRAAQFTAEGPDDDEPIDIGTKQRISLYADQPVGVVQGLRGAFVGLERDLSVARDAIIAVPGELMETDNVADAAKVALRSAPTIVLGPAISAAGAVGKTLLGAMNTLDPENKRRADEKYRSF